MHLVPLGPSSCCQGERSSIDRVPRHANPPPVVTSYLFWNATLFSDHYLALLVVATNRVARREAPIRYLGSNPGD